MKEKLLILGAGQYGMVAKEIAEEMGSFDKIDFLDDGNPIAVGRLGDYTRLRETYSAAYVALGNPLLRLEHIRKLERCGYRVVALVSPRAYVSPSATIGVGTAIEPFAVVQTGAVVGSGCIISSGAVVRHNARVGDGCHCDCNAVIIGGGEMPPGSIIRPGAVCDPRSFDKKRKRNADLYSFEDGV